MRRELLLQQLVVNSGDELDISEQDESVVLFFIVYTDKVPFKITVKSKYHDVQEWIITAPGHWELWERKYDNGKTLLYLGRTA